jgi:hypothetical protein
MSAAIVVNALKDLTNNKNLDHYDENLCADIKSRLDSKLREEKYSIDDRVEFVIILFALTHGLRHRKMHFYLIMNIIN